MDVSAVTGFVDTVNSPADSEFAPAFTSTVALGRYGRPEEIAAAVAFLVRPDSTYVTGTVLNVDGGYRVWETSPSLCASGGKGERGSWTRAALPSSDSTQITMTSS
jgi:hypothetical protein